MRRPLWPLAALGVLLGLAWYFVLRIGSRQAPDGRDPIDAEDALGYAMWAAALRIPDHADLARLWAPSSASDVEVMPEGRNFFPRMLEDIGGAKQSIHIMQYGFNPGVIADQFAPLLKEKSRAGVEVRIVLDSLGSHSFFGSGKFLVSLADAGVEIVLQDMLPPDRHGVVGGRRRQTSLRQTGRVEHRKLVMVDGATAYVGGAGIEDHFADGRFHDVYVRFRGPVTQQLQAIFLASFAYHGGQLTAQQIAAAFPGTGEEGEHRVTAIMNWPRGFLPLTDAARDLMRSATHRLDVINYYIGDAGMIREIAAAGRRGARVRLVVGDKAHANSMAYATLSHYYDELLDAGVEIYEYPAVVHAKVFVADNRALVGTLNLDAWALYRNPEMGLLFESADVADQFRTRLFDVDAAASSAGQRPVGAFNRARNRIYAKGSYVL